MATQIDYTKGIKCAGCKGYHASIQAVRECQTRPKPTVPITQVMDQAREIYEREERERQIKQQKLDLYQEIVKKGGYAAPGDDGKLRFYRITGSNKLGRENVRFINRYSSDRLIPINSTNERLKVLEQIVLHGIEESWAAFGQEMRKCGRCLKKLTDEKSRSHGIGPECWEIIGHTKDEW